MAQQQEAHVAYFQVQQNSLVQNSGGRQKVVDLLHQHYLLLVQAELKQQHPYTM
ncbi:MAG: hypothetical protein Q8808_02490 [Candidatus Phytoplasma australasiaticum]|nr:hypothetical protein [Candidatus Phytoplasma australasiaticum]